MARKQLGAMLVDAGIIDTDQLRAALGMQRHWGGPLGDTLVEMGLVDESDMVPVLAMHLATPSAQAILEKYAPDEQTLAALDGDFCRQNRCIPLGFDESGRFLDVAMADPRNLALHDEIRLKTRVNVRASLAGARLIDRCIREAYFGELPVADSVEDNLSWMDLYSGERMVEATDFGDRPKTAPRKAPPLPPPPPPLHITEFEQSDDGFTVDIDFEDHGMEGEGQAANEVEQLRVELEELRAATAIGSRDTARLKRIVRGLMTFLVGRGIASRDELLTFLREE